MHCHVKKRRYYKKSMFTEYFTKKTLKNKCEELYKIKFIKRFYTLLVTFKFSEMDSIFILQKIHKENIIKNIVSADFNVLIGYILNTG